MLTTRKLCPAQVLEQLGQLQLPALQEVVAQQEVQLSAAQHSRWQQQMGRQWPLVQTLGAMSPFIFRTWQRYCNELPFSDIATLQVELPAPGTYVTLVREALVAAQNEAEVGEILRRLRQLWLANLAAADVLQQISLATVLEHLSSVADAMIEVATDWLYQHFCQHYGTPVNGAGEAQPLLTIAMGKLGGHELNFSSDIDLIFCYPEAGETQGGPRQLENHVWFTRLVQALVKLLDSHNQHGFVYRVDLRLRPFGSAGPLVASFNALEHYYQEHGRDWERYAMVKARVIGAGQAYDFQLSELLRPFVYRRYIDFSVIDSLRKMKALIQQESSRRQLQDNIKLGPGGIREIEFIAQAFQLIRGGQERRLQTRSLVAAFTRIAELELLSRKEVERLLAAYEFLRTLEHRLQLIDDEQTQTLPTNPLRQQQVAAAMGMTWAEVIAELSTHTQAVNEIFQTIVGQQSDDEESTSPLQLLWQDLIETSAAEELLQEHLTDANKASAPVLWQRIHEFRQTLRKRESGPRGRKAIAKLVPTLLEHILASADPDTLLQRIFLVLARIASRTAYLELLLENPGARAQLLKLCAASEWIAQQIATYPLLLDELIDPRHLQDLPAFSDYPRLLDEYLLRIPEQDLETQMDVLRQARQALQLKIAAADIAGLLPLMKVSDHLSYLAEAIIADVVQLAWYQLVSKHGEPPGHNVTDTGFAVFAYGKLGGLELGYGSDLDLVFVSFADYQAQTTGPKPIEVQQFYLRLAQRILHLFNTRTLTGVLYEVDMRLRPAGKAGLLVTQAPTFAKYLAEDAWTWELQSLVRARPVYGEPQYRQWLAQLRQQQLQQPRERAQLAQQVRDMREKMRSQLGDVNVAFDLKHSHGGITDIEFLVQYLVLAYAAEVPALTTYTDNIRILEAAADCAALTITQSQQLIQHYQHLRALQHTCALSNQASNLADNHPDLVAVKTKSALIWQWWQDILQAADTNA